MMKMTAELASYLGIIENRPESKNYVIYKGLFTPNVFDKDRYFEAIENWREGNNLDGDEILEINLTGREIYKMFRNKNKGVLYGTSNHSE